MRLQHGIAVAGTHGKTTTTSLIASVLAEGGLDPTFVIGGRLEQRRHQRAPRARRSYLVAEADESDASFLHLQPFMAVVTNIDADHMDTYGGDFEQLKQAFVDFLHNLPFYGLAVAVHRRPEACARSCRASRKPVRHLRPRAPTPTCAPATSRSDGMPHALHGARVAGGRDRCRSTLNLPGRHNVLNALAAIAVAIELGVRRRGDPAARSPSSSGVGRRFQVQRRRRARGRRRRHCWSTTTATTRREMAATIAGGARRLAATPAGRARVPAAPLHAHARPARRLQRACCRRPTRCCVTEVYAAGEAPISGADGRALVPRGARRAAVEPVFVENVHDLPTALAEHAARRATWCSPWAPAASAGVAAALPQARAGEDGDDGRARNAARACAARCAATSRCAATLAGASAARPTRCYVPADRDDLAAFLQTLPAGRAAALGRASAATCWCATAACAAR
ncbi:MAG: Mur ligase family protein [Chromatiales bacterium]|nr:Mur ligase family protein [Chromatiales bacterium]